MEIKTNKEEKRKSPQPASQGDTDALPVSIRLLEDLGLSHACGTLFERHCIFQKKAT